MSPGFFGIPWWVYGLISLVLAAVWVVFWPADRLPPDAGALRTFLLRWGHALTWLLLAVQFFLRAGWGGAALVPLANVTALAALAVYIGFLTAILG